MTPRVFLITGTSTGFGNELVKLVLQKGDIAVATARKPSSLKFEGATDKNYLAISLDVTDKNSIDAAFHTVMHKFGRVDVVVNNAGYGLGGEFESLADDQIRRQMEVNFFGLMNVTRKAMETMRAQTPSGGVIQQVTSIGGQRGVPNYSIYCASKWAVEGFTEAISKEVKPEWGIKFTCVEPGGFRTDWAGRSMDFGSLAYSPDSSTKKENTYDHINAKKTASETNGTQPGEPSKAARAMYELAVMPDPPLRVVVGTDAYAAIMKKIEDYKTNYTKYEKLSISTDVDGLKMGNGHKH